jgi:hypothetical protein
MSDQPTPSTGGQAKLLTFLHVAVKQRAFQSELEAALPGIAVTAVGRVGDFERGLKEGQDAVLSLPVVLQAHGLGTSLQGARKGATEEPLALASVDAAPDPAKISTLGVLDFLGREGMVTLVQTVVGTRPKIERVTKVEDLLPLLQIQRVDAILLPLRLLSVIKASSRLNLVQRELTKGIGLPALASTGSGGSGILQAVRRLPSMLSSELGVTEWR